MHDRSYPVLDEEDAPLVEALTVGLNQPTARVLAYLLLRGSTTNEYATRLAIRVGTGLGRERVANALESLENRSLTDRTTIDAETPGRPPDGWRATVDTETARRRVRTQHAESLLDRAREVRDTLDPVDADGPPPSEPSAGDGLSVCLNWEPNGLQAPLLVAADQGSYGDHGVSVSFDHRYGSRAATAAVTDGDADVALVGAATLLRTRAAGHDLVPVALLLHRSLTALYATREQFDGEFTSVEQLRDRRVAMTTDSETGVLGRFFLSQANVLDDVTIEHVEGEEQATLLDGHADVATGVITDPEALAADGHEVDSVMIADHFPVPGPALVVHPGTLDARADDLVAFLSGLMCGWTALEQNVEHAARVVADRSSDPVHLERRRITTIRDRFAPGATREREWGEQSPESWRRLETALDRAGLLNPDD